MRNFLLPLVCVSAAAADRPAPVHPAILKSAQLEVTLDRDQGLPYQYRLVDNGAILHGEDSGREVSVTIFRAAPFQFSRITARPRSAQITNTRADFLFQIEAASFTLRYELHGPTLFVSLENVGEEPGFQLIEVATPDLATVREEDGPAWLAHGDRGGHTVALADAKAGHLPDNRFWFGVLTTLPVVMIGTSKAICVEEVTAFMDPTHLAVEGDPGHRRAELGTTAAYRVNGSLAWDMNANPGKPRIAGNANTPNLPVGQRPLARLDFAGDFDHSGTVDWLDGAKIVRARMPPIPSHYYDDKLLYSVHTDEPKYTPQQVTTFAQTLDVTRKVARLTAYAPQDVYLWGWQFRGKDTGYPSVAEVNARAGGLDALKKLIGDAHAFSANVSFSDNYDDAYKSSPAWDAKYIARQPDGELWESRDWTGETSYILGLAKYMAGPGVPRVRDTCKNYPVRDTYLVDVLSYYPIRNDWDPEHPASGIDNLLQGRYKVLDEFRKCGIDIVSEQMRYAFIGRNSVNDNGPAGEQASPFGGDPIPLAAAIYRKSAIWGFAGNAWHAAPEIYTLFYNGHEFPWYPQADLNHLVRFYFTAMVPWYQVHYRNIESFQRTGDRATIGLEGNAAIDIDWKTNHYSVTIDGAEIAADGATFCPIGNDRIAFYSKAGGKLSAALPKGWIASGVAAFALYEDRAEEVPVAKAGGKLSVDTIAGRPIMLFRDGGAGRKLLTAK